MQRYRLLLEYDGGPFQGWQKQAGAPTIQGELEAALARITGQPVDAVCSGRTDAGVHAEGQVVHLDLPRPMLPTRLAPALNAQLRPHPIAVLNVVEASRDFHARYDALRRSYVYRLLDRRAPPTLLRGRVWHLPLSLDGERMHAAGQLLLGKHDMTSFRASECQAKSPIRTLDLLHVRREGPVLAVRVAARSFLHHQVRNIVGTLVKVGLGERPITWLREVLEARDRSAAGQTAPADGLVLERVDYR
jgi:tRNA pseudouridine38-40 synthase